MLGVASQALHDHLRKFLSMCAFKVCEGEESNAHLPANIVCLQAVGHMRLEMDSKIQASLIGILSVVVLAVANITNYVAEPVPQNRSPIPRVFCSL